MLLHDLHLRFNSPTVNLYFTAGDFVKFCRNIKFYLSQDITEDKSTDKDYPVGTIGLNDEKITIYFMHYENFSDAVQKWHERAKRINWENLYIIMTDGTACNETIAREFDLLPYEHKALLTYRDLEGIKSAVKLKGRYIQNNGIGAPFLFDYKSIFSVRRVIDDWDYVKFFNS